MSSFPSFGDRTQQVQALGQVGKGGRRRLPRWRARSSCLHPVLHFAARALLASTCMEATSLVQAQNPTQGCRVPSRPWPRSLPQLNGVLQFVWQPFWTAAGTRSSSGHTHVLCACAKTCTNRQNKQLLYNCGYCIGFPAGLGGGCEVMVASLRCLAK